MVWVFGNSSERIIIKDLNDVLYYRQKKQYTDTEFESSKDLQREIQKGRVIKLEHSPEVKSSLPDSIIPNSTPKIVTPTIDMSEVKRVIAEVISEQKTGGTDLKNLALILIPVIAETVRQEVSKVQIAQTGPGTQQVQFEDPKYIPEVKIGELKSNINIEGKAVEGSGVSDSLEALKRLNKSK